MAAITGLERGQISDDMASGPEEESERLHGEKGGGSHDLHAARRTVVLPCNAREARLGFIDRTVICGGWAIAVPAVAAMG
jgi:hypothetical protein